MGSTSMSGSDPNHPNTTTPASRVPIIDEAEYVEVKKQNEQLIEDVNMLVQQNVELKNLLQAL